MKTEEALLACEETVRLYDPDRYFASLFAPPRTRPLLFALYAFNYEVARIGELSREPMMGAIRLQWWREAVEEAREGRPRAHPAALGLAELFARAALRAGPFESLLEAREFDLGGEMFSSLDALESYCDATSSGLMRIAVEVMGGGDDLEFLGKAGIAYGITGLLRALPFHAVRRKLYLPLDLLAEEKLSPDDIFAGLHSPSLARVMRTLSRRAGEHIAGARTSRPGRQARMAALPAALVPLYLRRMARESFNPFRDTSDVPLFRRQLALLQTRMSGRL